MKKPTPKPVVRKRKPLAITLSEKAHLRLRGIASARHGGNLSAAIEFLIMASLLVACGGAPVDAPGLEARPAEDTTTEPYRLEAHAPRSHATLVTEPEDENPDPPSALNCKHEASGLHAAGCLAPIVP